MLRAEAEAIYAAGREAVVEALVELSAGCAEVSEKIAEQGARVEELGREVDELDRQGDRDSLNSSMPPSCDPPKSRAERRRIAREAYKRSMRQSGA